METSTGSLEQEPQLPIIGTPAGYMWSKKADSRESYYRAILSTFLTIAD
jgi:hypothetical protein